jgi:penicillin-binding protein 1C
VLAAHGGPAALHERLRACGLTTLTHPAEYYGLGLTLGNAEARLLELANAYACLARLGEFKPYRLVRRRGFETQGAGSKGLQVWNAGAAFLVADILSDNAARTMAFGMESSLRFDFPVACKTGTSSDFRDNWAFGYTPEFTVGVWVGNSDGQPMERISGVTGAAPILHEIFVHLHEFYGTTWFGTPTVLTERLIHPLTGKLLTGQTPGSDRVSVARSPAVEGITEKFLTHALPLAESVGDYDELGRVRLDAEYRDWLASPDNWLAGRVVLAEPDQTLRLVSPMPGTIIYLDPDLPESSRRLVLRAEGGGELTWESDSLECRAERGSTVALLEEGRHCLVVRNRQTGQQRETEIIVKPLAKRRILENMGHATH